MPAENGKKINILFIPETEGRFFLFQSLQEKR